MVGLVKIFAEKNGKKSTLMESCFFLLLSFLGLSLMLLKLLAVD